MYWKIFKDCRYRNANTRPRTYEDVVGDTERTLTRRAVQRGGRVATSHTRMCVHRPKATST